MKIFFLIIFIAILFLAVFQYLLYKYLKLVSLQNLEKHNKKVTHFDQSSIQLRVATMDDIHAIKNLFIGTVEDINRFDYTKKEIDEWIFANNTNEKWVQKIQAQYFIVAFYESQMLGFASLSKDGCLDMLFTHKNFQRKGVAQLMLNHLEKKANEQKNSAIYSNVSLTALKFFLHNGFSIEKEQYNDLGNETLINFRMTKPIKIQ